jgi:hypothetical protein
MPNLANTDESDSNRKQDLEKKRKK